MKAILAMASNRVIGDGMRIPWHLPDDFKWFKKTTMGCKLVMGNTTFNAIGRPLAGRHTHVVTRNGDKLMSASGIRWNSSNSELYSYVTLADVLQMPSENMWVCGGAQIYEQLLPHCSEVYATHVIGDFDGDVFMPPFEADFPRQTVIMEHKDFWVVKHSR